ncbi:MAG TPA: penicillin-binding transpeptidase domain-containing protein, partial [Terrimicrobiaceae bacterium]
MFCAALIVLGGALIISPETVKGAFSGREGALVVLNKTGQAIIRYDEAACAEKLPPCSTFKIWNSAIGLETGIVSDPDAPFWKWDGQKRWLGDWNRD